MDATATVSPATVARMNDRLCSLRSDVECHPARSLLGKQARARLATLREQYRALGLPVPTDRALGRVR